MLPHQSFLNQFHYHKNDNFIKMSPMNKFILILFLISPFYVFSQITFSYDVNGNLVSKDIQGNTPNILISGVNNACHGDTLLLTASGGVSYTWDDGTTAVTKTIVVDTTFEYITVVGYGANGCSKEYIKYIDVAPTIHIDSIQGDILVQNDGTSYTYNITNHTNATYHWNVVGGSISSSNGASQIDIVWTDTIGYLSVYAAIGNACPSEVRTLQVEVQENEQFVPVNAGWNMVSTFLHLNDMTTANAYSHLGGNLLQIKDEQNAYDPSAPPFLNTLNSMTDGQGYWLKVTNLDTVEYYGQELNPTMVAIPLDSGWNLIGYPVSDHQSVQNALGSIMSDVILMKNIQYSYSPTVPSFLNTLNTLYPGEAYWLNVSTPTTLYYPIPPENITIPNPDLLGNSGWQIKAYPNSMTVYGKTTFNGDTLQAGDVIGAFINGECRGAGRVQTIRDSSYISFVINGVIPNEDITFLLYTDSLIYTSKTIGKFSPSTISDTLWHIPFSTQQATNTNEFQNNLMRFNAFPNPFSNALTIEWDMDKNSNVLIQVFSVDGKLVERITNQNYQVGDHQIIWTPAPTVNSGIYLIQIKTPTQVGNQWINYQK